MSRITKIITAAALVAICACSSAYAAPAKKQSAVPEPSFPPLKHEYYPISNKKFPENVTNPNAHVRDVIFRGQPLDVFTKIDMVSQVVLPSPPMFVAIGKPEAFTVDIVPEFNSVFLKPVAEVEKTNLIVHTEGGGVYIFILKENPYVPWDIRCRVKDPYRQVKADDTESIVNMLYSGKRHANFQFVPMDLRSPNSSAYVYDPLTKMGCQIVLKRALALPKSNKTAYWIEFSNIVPGKKNLPTTSYSISERSIYTPNIRKVAIPGFRSEAYPLLEKGDKLQVFVISDQPAIPPIFKFRFALMGSKNIPIDAQMPTLNPDKSSGVKAAEVSIDERLQAEYDKLVKQGKIKPATQEELDAAYADEQAESPENTGGTETLRSPDGSNNNLNNIFEQTQPSANRPIPTPFSGKNEKKSADDNSGEAGESKPIKVIGFPSAN